MEGVVDALHRLQASLVPGGLVVDTQPIEAGPILDDRGEAAGKVDQGGWLDVVEAVDACLESTLREGLFELRHEQWFTIVHAFDSGPECVEEVGGWRGVRLPAALAARLRGLGKPVTLEQAVRLRLLAAQPRWAVANGPPGGS